MLREELGKIQVIAAPAKPQTEEGSAQINAGFLLCLAAKRIVIPHFAINRNEQEVLTKMSVFRIERNKNYTVMSNYHLRDTTISLNRYTYR